jgi:hypothetical protein
MSSLCRRSAGGDSAPAGGEHLAITTGKQSDVMNSRSRLILTGALALAAAMALTGCVQAPLPSAKSGAPSRFVTRASMTKPIVNLTFAAGQDLSGSAPQLGDTLDNLSGWTLTSPDNGRGHWAYSTADRRCAVTFQQNIIDGGVAVVDGDDRATTDSYLRSMLRNPSADFVDGSVAYGLGKSATIAQTRVITHVDKDGTQRLTAARAFSKNRTAMHVSITCKPGVDSVTVFHDVLEHVAILAY